MTDLNIPLVVVTIIWALMIWGAFLPIYSLPVARIKRELSSALLAMGSLCIAVEWLTTKDMHPVSMLSLSAFILFCGIMVYLLKKLDYYVEEILQELFVLAMTSAGIGLITSIWYWGIDGFVGLNILRVSVALIPIFVSIISWVVARQNYSLWSVVIYTILLIIKWVTLPMWGIWTIILLMLYSTLVGYIANWMVSTTYAEKVFSWNIAPAKVWSILALSAGVLVLFF